MGKNPHPPLAFESSLRTILLRRRLRVPGHRGLVGCAGGGVGRRPAEPRVESLDGCDRGHGQARGAAAHDQDDDEVLAGGSEGTIPRKRGLQSPPSVPTCPGARCWDPQPPNATIAIIKPTYTLTQATLVLRVGVAPADRARANPGYPRGGGGASLVVRAAFPWALLQERCVGAWAVRGAGCVNLFASLTSDSLRATAVHQTVRGR